MFKDNLSAPSSRIKECLTFEDGTDSLSQNISNKLPIYATKNPRRAQISFTSQKKLEIKQLQYPAHQYYSML
jgi:hypothetical protein